MPVGNHSPSVEQVRGFLISTKEFTEYFLAQIAARKQKPTGDLLCDIANARIDGEELTDDEMNDLIAEQGDLQEKIGALRRRRATRIDDDEPGAARSTFVWP